MEDELKGEGNSYDFGARMYDPRVGRWLSVDPLRNKAPGITPYRFGLNNPLKYIDPNGEFEEDGHFWTVYAYAVSRGLSKQTAFKLAQEAEYYDHKVHKDFKMEITPIEDLEFLSWGKDDGLGTWADEKTQGAWHGLNGKPQDQVLAAAKQAVLSGDLKQLHLISDAWAHSYINKDGERIMMGGVKLPFSVPLLGRITLQHSMVDENGKVRILSLSGDTTDEISENPQDYKNYIKSLDDVFNNTQFAFNKSINKDGDAWFFEYVQKNAGNKENNIFLLSAYVDIMADKKTNYVMLSKERRDLLVGFLKEANINFTTTGSQQRDLSGKVIFEGYNVTIQYEKK